MSEAVSVAFIPAVLICGVVVAQGRKTRRRLDDAEADRKVMRQEYLARIERLEAKAKQV